MEQARLIRNTEARISLGFLFCQKIKSHKRDSLPQDGEAHRIHVSSRVETDFM